MRTAGLLSLVTVIACGGPETSRPAPPIENTSVAPESVAPVPVQVASGLALTSIEPERGDAAGGTYVALKGRNFLADGPRMAKVYFGSQQGTVVRFASDTELIVQAPGGTAGQSVDILVVFDPGGTLTLPNAFTFVQP
jgi:hypothetical protein